MVYSDYDSSFREFPEMANENTIHLENPHILMTEINQFSNGLTPPIISEIFEKKHLL